MRMIKEKDLIENKDVRESLITRVEVLDRVKELNTLADTDYMTTRQVAEFYEVDMNVVQQIWSSNRGEIDSDGVVTINYNDLGTYLGTETISMAKRMRGKAIVAGEPFSYSKNTLFPKRAVLRIGMLLRDSEVAKEVRTMLLNMYYDVQKDNSEIIEKINKEYDDEMELHSELGHAIMVGDMDKVIIVTTKINEIKNRRIREAEEKLAKSEEEKAEIITNSTTIQETRQVIRRIVNMIAHRKYGNNFSLAWNELHKKVNYTLDINVKNRGGSGSLIDKYTPEELKEVEKIVKSWGSKVGIDVVKALELA